MKSPKAPALHADAEYFKAFAEIMRRIAGALGKPAKPVVVCIAGGAALHLYTGARVSKDIDATIMARFLPPQNLEVAWRDADGHARLLYFDTQYNDAFGLLHEDAYEDALAIDVPGVDAARMQVRLRSPLDLAVSKLSRYETHDQEDIAALARAGLIEATALRRRAEEALPAYVGDIQRVKNSIALAEKLVNRSKPR